MSPTAPNEGRSQRRPSRRGRVGTRSIVQSAQWQRCGQINESRKQWSRCFGRRSRSSTVATAIHSAHHGPSTFAERSMALARITGLTAFTAATLCWPAAPAPVSPGNGAVCPDSTAVDTFFAQYRRSLPPSLALQRGALVIVCGGRSAFAAGFGRTAAGDTVDPNRTIFRAASNSKLFAATAVMQLADRGLWTLDDDVNRYLPPDARLAALSARPACDARPPPHPYCRVRGQVRG